MANTCILHVLMHLKCLFNLYLLISLIITINSKPQYYDSIALILDRQEPNAYSCRLSQSQIKKSSFLTDAIVEFDQDTGKILFDPDTNSSSAPRILLDGFEVISDVLTYSTYQFLV